MSIVTQNKVEDLPLSSNVVDEIDINSLSDEMMRNIAISYNGDSRCILLDAGYTRTSVDCDAFISAGILSSAELCGTQLVLKFNADASKNAISVELSSLEEGGQLSNYFDKRLSNEVSGDVAIFQHGMNILSGNYIQTNTSLSVNNYSSGNAFLQANIDSLYGNSYVGSKVFCIVGVISSSNQIKLSGDVSILKDIVEGRKRIRDFYENVDKSRSLTKVFENYDEATLNLDTYLSDALFSMTIDDKSSSIKYRIQDVDVNTGIVTLASPLTNEFASFDGKLSNWFIEKFNNDDNAFYLVGFPEIGNIIPNNMFGQHVEGGSVRAIGRQTHVEGRDNVADIRYSHAEGSHNIAGDMASHAEGFLTEADGRYSHSEGFKTIASGIASHAEGESTIAAGEKSHAGGWGSKAYGNWSFAQGRYAEASSYSTVATGAYVSAYATNTIAMGTYALADDKRAFVWNGLGSNSSADYYSSNGDSTFNINPSGKTKGFYIGLSSLDDYLQKNANDAISYIEDNDLSSYAKEDSLSSYMKTINTATMTQEMYGWVTSSGIWGGYTPNASLGDQHIKFITIPVQAGQEISISACMSNPARICFLSGDFPAIPDRGKHAPLVGNTPFDTPFYNVVLAGQISSVVVPEKATMLFCCSNWRGINSLPSIEVDGIHVQAPSQMNLNIEALRKHVKSQATSRTCNKFNKDDPDNVNNVRLNAGAYYNANELTSGANVWGLTHYIPCKKDNVLVVSRVKTARYDDRVVVRGIQYFDKDFNQICCQQSSSLTGMTDFREVPRSSFVNRKTWWTQVSADACEYVKLTYAYHEVENNVDMSSLFMVQVEPPNFTPTEVIDYVPFKKTAENEPKSGWNEKNILFAGDSITRPLIKQYSSSQAISSNTGLAKKGYAEFVCDMLNAKQIKDNSTAWDGAMLALSSPNAQTSGRRSLVTNISSWPDDVDAVHVMIGTNDWNYSWPDLGSFNDLSDINYDNLSTFYGALGYACRELLEKYPGKPIAFSTPIKRWQNGGFDVLSDIVPSNGWIKNDGTWNNGSYQYKLIPILYPNSQIEIQGSSHPSCDTWYTFLSCWPRTSGYVGVYAPTSPLSAYTPGQHRINRGTVKTFTSPPIPSYLWVTYSRNDDPPIYGSDAGNAWPTYIKINGIDVTASGYKVPYGLRYDMPNSKGSTLDEFVKAIKDVCGYYGIKVIDLFNECPINPIIQSHRDILIPDGTHPSPKGHQLIAKYVAGAFNEIID